MTDYLIVGMLVVVAACSPVAALDAEQAQAFVGQDLHLSARDVASYQVSTAEHVLTFSSDFSLSTGTSSYRGRQGVVWLTEQVTEVRGRRRIDYVAQVYIRGELIIKRSGGAGTVDIDQRDIEKGRQVVLTFPVTGQVFVTAQNRQVADPRESKLYKVAYRALKQLPEPEPVIEPALEEPAEFVEQPQEVAPPVERDEMATVEGPVTEPQAPVAEEERGPRFQYPVNISPATEEALEFESTPATGEGITDALTVQGRFYLWQKLDEQGRLLELQADNAVVYYSRAGFDIQENAQLGEVFASGAVAAIYMSGDVVLTQGKRTIRADEIFYAFRENKALATNAVMRTFDVEREIPIYVRAEKLRQTAANQFRAEDIVLTTSEFHKPQLSLEAEEITITDLSDYEKAGVDEGFDAVMRNMEFKYGTTTLLRLPKFTSDMERPDLPFKRLHVGTGSSIWGTSVETQWYLSRLLGLKEPEGTDSELSLDYYSKRGPGAGVEIEYNREDFFGNVVGYIIDDHGEDRLGGENFRQDLEPPRDLRGRFRLQHRHFLPYNWQMTLETSYLSDENFLEQYYRGEYLVGKEQETIFHMKRLEENWALSLLGKVRINDFADQLEQYPSVEYHKVGESLFDDEVTLYTDTQVGSYRQRIGDDHNINISEENFAFAWHRTEMDVPLKTGAVNFVPFVAGNFGYDDRSGFARGLVDGTMNDNFGTQEALIGEAGVRAATRFWKVYPNVESRLWDVHDLRHIVEPYMTAVAFAENDKVAEQRDILNLGLSQRLQTKRGTGDKQRTVDWMRLDTSFTFVNDSVSDNQAGADRFIWNKPFVPLTVMSTPEIFNGDFPAPLRRFEMFGPRRNYFGADYIWRVSDTTAVLSDLYFDTQSGTVEQYNFGFSRLVWPNLSYYLGTRYLRDVNILNEQGSNTFTFAATYVLDPRYTLVFAQQFDFDYGVNVRSDITLIRQYHRMYYGFTFSADESLDSSSFIFSIWPQGVPELALGQRRYMQITPVEY